MLHDFSEAHDREFADVVPGVEPAREHARTANAGKTRAGKAGAQRVDEIGAKLVAGILARDQGDQRGVARDGGLLHGDGAPAAGVGGLAKRRRHGAPTIVTGRASARCGR